MSPADMVTALAAQKRENVRLGALLLARGMVTQAALDAALARQFGLRQPDLRAIPPERALAPLARPETCLRLGFVPWRRDLSGRLVLAVAEPDRMAVIAASLPADAGPVHMVFANRREVEAAIVALYRDALLLRAETRCAAADSCRGRSRLAPLLCASVLPVLLALNPALLFGLILALCVLTLISGIVLRLAGALSTLTARARHIRGGGFRSRRDGTATIARLPCVSVLVPLHREADVLPRLVDRLNAIDYPRELLDICLVVEEKDAQTRDAIAAAGLPPWMRTIAVPDARLKTKPRAMNYALDFCRGTIVGVYDAEDAPEPGQIRAVVERFHARGPDLACVQGVLDYYNSRQNWLARCFTVEYAAWFRLVLPGLQSLGLPVPLGGTTLFMRRDVLEELGGWDAHNVTEDADLGMRIARRGYRVEFIRSVTREEATCHPWRWVRQRSRWLKGFAITWATHMRNPRRLRADLGWSGFLTLQALFLGTVAGFAAAPVLWSFWLWTLTGTAPVDLNLPDWAMWGLGGLFLLSEASIIAAGLIATAGREHRHLWPWVPTLHFYFPLATLAAWKALYELVSRPFYWDKTDHGHSMTGGAAKAGPERRCSHVPKT
ncbi:glycosyltransferase [Maritimibacter sp. 55A14]|uniref:glycosyltransferase n=1 Tax=Maritimibacter sp. 55A14 TaxID=2174844 RepID=UPI001304B482|nr:glycosyltransferase [Maritimibacter sp. 55A14]